LKEYGLSFGPATPDSLRAVAPGLLPPRGVSLWHCNPEFPKRYRRERSTGKQACRQQPATGKQDIFNKIKVQNNQSKHNYLFLKKISYVFGLKYSHHQAYYENKKEKFTGVCVLRSQSL
jgi:hypothetical protein